MKLRAVPRAECLSVLQRAFSTPVETPGSNSARRRKTPAARPSDLTFTFDCETTVDAAQRFRVGFCQIREREQLLEEHLIVDEGALTSLELATCEAYCRANGLSAPLPLEAFRALFLKACHAGTVFVGFNLPFDIARIAVDWSVARASRGRSRMQGGFSFKLSDDPRQPRIQIKNLDSRRAFIELTVPGTGGTTRSRLKKGQRTPAHRGFFADVRTLAGAVLSGSFSLERLCRFLGTPTQKLGRVDHGAELSESYLDYARSDVTATWECYDALSRRLATYAVGKGAWEVTSEASVGKAILEQIGVRPWLKVQPDADPSSVGRLMSTYYGGRTEVRVRRQIVPVVQTDFMSMYPTVSVLMGLWRYVIAKGFTEAEATEDVREFLEAAQPDDFQNPRAWRNLAAIVLVQPDADLLPVRAHYRDEAHSSIGLNYVSNLQPMWFTLADCLVAKFLGGRTPHVHRAIRYLAGPIQKGLRRKSLLGRIAFDPRKDDLYQLLIRERLEVKSRKFAPSGQSAGESEQLAQAIKITANSTSYGIFVQLNVQRTFKRRPVRVYPGFGEPFEIENNRIEQPGPFFHPLLATLTTGAARLMLGLAQHRVEAEGLDWCFCDTDSMAIAQPNELERDEFERRARSVVDWFCPLNPYGSGASILKVEEVNHMLAGVDASTLMCLAVSSKRYALFNSTRDSGVILRKVSSHGLGHLMAPSEGDGSTDGTPNWQRRFWSEIIQAEMAGRTEGPLIDGAEFLTPALSRYAATSPTLMRWFRRYNAGKPYAEQVKPFGFLYALHARRSVTDGGGSRRRGDRSAIHPVAPFAASRNEALSQAFDRETQAPIAIHQLRTLKDALRPYALKPESKFLAAEPCDRGPTRPRHVEVDTVIYIGKEADRWEEEYVLGGEGPMEFGAGPSAAAQLAADLADAMRCHGAKAVADATQLSRSTIAKIAAGSSVRVKQCPARVRRQLAMLSAASATRRSDRDDAVNRLRAAVVEHGGIRAAARALSVDPSNLAKRLKRQSWH